MIPLYLPLFDTNIKSAHIQKWMEKTDEDETTEKRGT